MTDDRFQFAFFSDDPAAFVPGERAFFRDDPATLYEVAGGEGPAVLLTHPDGTGVRADPRGLVPYVLRTFVAPVGSAVTLSLN